GLHCGIRRQADHPTNVGKPSRHRSGPPHPPRRCKQGRDAQPRRTSNLSEFTVRERILPILPVWVVSTALLVAMAVFCVRSRSRSDILGFFTPAGDLQAIASDRDGLLLFFSNVPFGPEAGLSAGYMTVSADEFQAAHAMLYGASKAKKPHESHFAGFRHVRDQFTFAPTIAWWYRAITIPYWFLILLLAILP